MWVPTTESEIQLALEQGTVRETAIFDAKTALPASGRNKDLARDICAMTVDGGMLLYGLGGEDPTHPTELTPVELAGAAERVDQVAQTALAEPPAIEIHDFAATGRPGYGYLAVEVPPSPRAPHMVVLGGDNRYYGRGATGNRILGEAEVGRLYQRRERWDIDREAWLDGIVTELLNRYAEDVDAIDTLGPMAVAVRPVLRQPDLLHRAANSSDVRQLVQAEIPQVGRDVDVYPDQGTSGLGQAYAVTRRGADIWIVSADKNAAPKYRAELDVSSAGDLTYWHSPTVNTRLNSDVPFLLERSVTRAVHQTLAVAHWLYRRASFAGPADVGVAIVGLSNAHGASLTNSFGSSPRYGAADYRRHRRAPSPLLGDPESLTRELLTPLFEAISAEDYDPYADHVRAAR